MRQSKIRRYFKHGTLTQLMVFDAVARHGNFTRAAEELHLAQPTVSLQMKKLAETVGAPLFEQIGRQVHLTPAGRRLHEACGEIFASLADADAALARLRGVESGSLRIAASTTAKYLASRLLVEFVRRHPGIEISLHVGSRASLMERLDDNADDLYIFVKPPDDAQVVAQRIAPNPLVVFAPEDHLLAGEKEISFERFAREALLLREPGSGTRMMCDEVFARHGRIPRVLMELGSNEAIGEAMLSGLGPAVLCRYALGFDAATAPLKVLDVEGFPIDVHWHLAYPVGKELALIAQAFMAFARTEAERMMASTANRIAPPALPATA